MFQMYVNSYYRLFQKYSKKLLTNIWNDTRHYKCKTALL